MWDAIDTRISRPQVKREDLLLYSSLTLIVIGGLLLRILPYFSTEMLLKGLDPWIQYECAGYINEHGLKDFLNWFDHASWYPYGRNMGKSMYIIVPMVAVIIYKIALFLGINVTLFAITYFTPAIFGALTIFVIYKLGQVLHSKRTGVLAAFFVTLAQGFMSRTVVGFYDNECIGILLMFLTFYFFMKGMTKDSMINNVFAGLTLGALSLTWGAYRYAYDFLALFAFVMILLRKYSRRLFASFSITIIIGLIVGSLIPRNGVGFAFSTEQLIPLLIIVLMLIMSIYQEIRKHIQTERIKKFIQYGVLVIIGIGIIAAIVLYALGIIAPIAQKFLRTILPTMAETLPLIESVAENSTAAWGTIFFNVYIMVFLLPLGFYFAIKKPNEKTLFILVLGLTGTYFGGSMVRLSLIFAPAAAIVSGYTIDEVLRPFALIFQERFTISRRKKRAAKQIGRELIATAYIFLAVILMMTAIFSINMSNQQYADHHELTPRLTSGGTTELAHDYQETFDFISRNIAPYNAGEKPPLVMSWWDYGYQLRVLGNVTTLVDNATINSTQIGLVGAMLIHNETESLKLLKRYGVDYVLVLSPGRIDSPSNDIAKSLWCMQIAEEYAPDLGIKYRDYYIEDPNETETAGFTDAFWDSVLYKLCAYKLDNDGTYGGNQPTGIPSWRDGELENAPNVGPQGKALINFEMYYQSSWSIFRLYKVIY